MEDDDDLDFEEFAALTEAQQDAILEREQAEYCRWWDTLTPEEQKRIRVRRNLEIAVRQRKLMKTLPFFAEHLRETQRRLVKLRYVGVAGGLA